MESTHVPVDYLGSRLSPYQDGDPDPGGHATGLLAKLVSSSHPYPHGIL